MNSLRSRRLEVMSGLASRVSLSRARSFLRPLLPSACYVAYFMKYAQILSPYIKIHKVARKRCNLGHHRPFPTRLFKVEKEIPTNTLIMLVEIELPHIWKPTKLPHSETNPANLMKLEENPKIPQLLEETGYERRQTSN